MVDNVSPISNFHPYQPVSDVPATEKPPEGWRGLLQKVRSIDARGSIGRVREWAKENPALLLGGLAALAIGVGLVRKLRA